MKQEDLDLSSLHEYVNTIVLIKLQYIIKGNDIYQIVQRRNREKNPYQMNEYNYKILMSIIDV